MGDCLYRFHRALAPPSPLAAGASPPQCVCPYLTPGRLSSRRSVCRRRDRRSTCSHLVLISPHLARRPSAPPAAPYQQVRQAGAPSNPWRPPHPSRFPAPPSFAIRRLGTQLASPAHWARLAAPLQRSHGARGVWHARGAAGGLSPHSSRSTLGAFRRALAASAACLGACRCQTGLRTRRSPRCSDGPPALSQCRAHARATGGPGRAAAAARGGCCVEHLHSDLGGACFVVQTWSESLPVLPVPS